MIFITTVIFTRVRLKQVVTSDQLKCLKHVIHIQHKKTQCVKLFTLHIKQHRILNTCTVLQTHTFDMLCQWINGLKSMHAVLQLLWSRSGGTSCKDLPCMQCSRYLQVPHSQPQWAPRDSGTASSGCPLWSGGTAHRNLCHAKDMLALQWKLITNIAIQAHL